MSLRIATWNIHRGIGSDGREDFSRIRAVLDELGADVIALQEVGYRSLSSKEAARELAGALSLTLIPGVTLTDEAGDYGNALLTRLSVDAVERTDLSVPGREPRGLIEAHLSAGEVSLRILATHLGLKASERRVQLDRIQSRLSQTSADIDVLLGDFNEWFFFSRGIRRIDRRLASAANRPATFPSRRPLLALDRIWTGPAGVVKDVRVHATPLARIASDHLPLVAELQVAGATQGEASPAP